jgi:hypothetical protein
VAIGHRGFDLLVIEDPSCPGVIDIFLPRTFLLICISATVFLIFVNKIFDNIVELFFKIFFLNKIIFDISIFKKPQNIKSLLIYSVEKNKKF